jgi:hypothetical protein
MDTLPLLLLHVPPATLLLNDTVDPMHTCVGPEITAVPLTVTAFVA